MSSARSECGLGVFAATHGHVGFTGRTEDEEPYHMMTGECYVFTEEELNAFVEEVLASRVK